MAKTFRSEKKGKICAVRPHNGSLCLRREPGAFQSCYKLCEARHGSSGLVHFSDNVSKQICDHTDFAIDKGVSMGSMTSPWRVRSCAVCC